MMKRLITAVLAAAACFAFPLHASAADAEDVFQAMRDVGCTESMITDVRTQYESQTHDDYGMEMGGEYHTFDEWVVLVREGGIEYVLSVIYKEFGVDPETLRRRYNLQTTTAPAENGESGTTVTTTTYVPSVEPEKPFVQMTLDEMKAYVNSLPEEERAEFLFNLTPEQRRSILRQLPVERKAEVAEGMAEFGRTIGLNVTVDSADEDGVKLSVRDEDGKLIDSTSLGLTVDPTGWDTTLPVLGGAGMVLAACGGLYLIGRRQKEEQNG